MDNDIPIKLDARPIKAAISDDSLCFDSDSIKTQRDQNTGGRAEIADSSFDRQEAIMNIVLNDENTLIM